MAESERSIEMQARAIRTAMGKCIAHGHDYAAIGWRSVQVQIARDTAHIGVQASRLRAMTVIPASSAFRCSTVRPASLHQAMTSSGV